MQSVLELLPLLPVVLKILILFLAHIYLLQAENTPVLVVVTLITQREILVELPEQVEVLAAVVAVE
jgi:hypothetical protein